MKKIGKCFIWTALALTTTALLAPAPLVQGAQGPQASLTTDPASTGEKLPDRFVIGLQRDTQLYNGPGRAATDRTLPAGSLWLATYKAISGGEAWYEIGADQWVKAKDVGNCPIVPRRLQTSR